MTKLTLVLIAFLGACTSGTTESKNLSAKEPVPTNAPPAARSYRGAISNGMKGDSLFFTVSKDGKKLQNLTFKGYWRCSGKLEQTTVGPDGVFEIAGGIVKGHITEPPNGGSTAWRYDLEADIKGAIANGTFRMAINNLGCDTYKLQWTAVAK